MRSTLLVAVLLLSGCGASPRSPFALAHLDEGATLLSEGELDRAEARFRLALEFQPDLAEARMNLGLVELARGRLEPAAAELRAALAIRPDFAEAHGNLGVVLDRMGDRVGARHELEAALAIHPGLAFARRDLSRLLVGEGELVAARAHLLRLLEETPSDAESQALLGWVELRLGRPDAATERVELALAVEPAPPLAYFVRAVVALGRGELAEVEADLERAEADASLANLVAVRRATLALLRGDAEGALRLVGPVLDEDPFDAAAHLVAACASLALDRPADALVHADAALEVEPELEAALTLRAEARSRLGG